MLGDHRLGRLVHRLVRDHLHRQDARGPRQARCTAALAYQTKAVAYYHLLLTEDYPPFSEDDGTSPPARSAPAPRRRRSSDLTWASGTASRDRRRRRVRRRPERSPSPARLRSFPAQAEADLPGVEEGRRDEDIVYFGVRVGQRRSDPGVRRRRASSIKGVGFKGMGSTRLDDEGREPRQIGSIQIASPGSYAVKATGGDSDAVEPQILIGKYPASRTDRQLHATRTAATRWAARRSWRLHRGGRVDGALRSDRARVAVFQILFEVLLDRSAGIAARARVMMMPPNVQPTRISPKLTGSHPGDAPVRVSIRRVQCHQETNGGTISSAPSVTASSEIPGLVFGQLARRPWPRRSRAARG